MKKVFLFFRTVVKKIDFLLGQPITEAVEIKERFIKEGKWYFKCKTKKGLISFPVSVNWYKSPLIKYVEFTYITSVLFPKKIHGLQANQLTAAAHQAAVFLTKIQTWVTIRPRFPYKE